MRVLDTIRSWPRGTKIVAAIAFLAGVAPAMIAGDAVVRARLPNGGSGAPVRVYARPVVLAPGSFADRDAVEGLLDRLGYRAVRSGRLGPGQYRIRGDEWTIGRRAFPEVPQLAESEVATVRVDGRERVRWIEGANGADLTQLVLEPEQIGALGAREGDDELPVSLDEVPDDLVQAVLAIEDRRFYEHHGVDVRRIGGALLADIRAGRVVEGGSTITQQLARTLFLSTRRTPYRKIRELAMALVLEARYSKRRLLEAYLNQIYLGQDGPFAVRGVGRAARFYFGKDVRDLDLAESALIAGLIRGPNLYSPRHNPERARERRDLVLRVMEDVGAVTASAARSARGEPVRVRRRPETVRSARYFTDYVRDELRDSHALGGEAGRSVFTSLDMRLQLAAERAVRRRLAELERTHPRLKRDGTPLQAALVALDPWTGEILAMVGGRDYRTSQFNRAVNAHRQPGSAFKPVVALAALAGRSVTLASTLQDEPLEVETPAGVWKPTDYDGRFRGDVTVRDALERSLNVPFARLGLAIGPERIVDVGHRLGIESPLAAVPSLALGASEVTPLEMARAFGVLAAYGTRAESHAVLGVLDRAGRVIERTQVARARAFEPAETYLVTSALEGAVEEGTGRGLRRRGFRGAVAAKSGTTNDFRDAWFIGYTPSLAIAVWVGFDDGRSIGLPGASAALPIFADFLTAAVGPDGLGSFPVPNGVEMVRVNAETGLRAGFGCSGETEVFLAGTAPDGYCSPFGRDFIRIGDAAGEIRAEVARLLSEIRRRLLRAER